MIPYGEPLDSGFWGTPTSTIDWCEENYVVTYYLAEAVNTVTNAFFMILAGYSLRNVMRNGMETRFVLCTLGFMLVGLGSWLFHMTLKYHFQLLDELPMIYTTCIPVWFSFSYSKGRRYENICAWIIFAGAMTLTVLYLVFRNPTIHQAAYGALNVTIIIKNVRLVYSTIKDKAALSNLNWTLVLGVSEFLFAWFLWNMDIHFCDYWRSWRRSIGLPWGMLLEGHGWWHLFTGLGVYSYLIYLEYLRAFQLGLEKKYVFVWKFGFLPVIELSDEAKRLS